MNPAAENARRQLASAGRRKDFARRLGTGLAAGSLLLLAILLVALIDYWLMLPPAARWTALILIVGMLVAGLVRLVRVLRHPTDLKEAALDVEAQSPDLGCEVSTAAEYLTGQKAPSQAYEAEIADALEARAARAIERKGTSYNRRFLTPFVVAGVVVLLGLVGFLVFAPASGTAFLRTAAPWSQASFTLLEVHPQGGEYPVGLEISLTNVVSGRPPKSVEFQWKEAGSGRWARVPLVLQTNSVAFHTLLVSTSGVYRVLAGDAVSPEYRIDAYIPPKVDTLTIGLTPPAYTRIPPSEQTAGEITVLRGAKAVFRVGGNVPLGTVALEFTNGTSLALKPAGSNLWTADLVVTNDTDYAFVLTDAKGRAGIDHTRFHIQALPDHPPKVDIAEPGEDIRADPTDIVPLKVVASDDFGVESIRIVYHKLGEPEKVLEVRDRHVKDGETLAAGVIRLEEMNLKPFEVVAYHAEARDNNTFDGPGIGRSPTYFIEITDRTSPPPSKRKGPPQQKLNLLAIQKGIVADTTALPSNAPTNAYVDLAQRQRDAREFAEMYRSKLEAMGAPFAAQGAMESAVEEMGKAAKKLALKSRGESLPAEEKALAHLYEAVKAMPQLKNLPTKPTEPGEKPPEATPAEKDPVSVVLEEMRKKPKEVPNQKELEEALKEARELARAQGELAAQMERPQKGDADGEGDGKGKGPGEGKEPAKDSKEAKEAARLKEMAARAQQREASGKSPGELAGKPPGEKPAPGQGESGKDGKKGQGQGQAQEEGKGKGQGKGSGQGQPTPGEMAAAEQKMSEKAKALAEKVKRLADKESRQGQGAGKRMEEASRQMAEAAKALQQGNQPGAGSAGAIGAAGLNSAADLLEKAISGKPELSDVSAEEAPKKFEGQISDYFKRLTRAE
jgi:hypothetical protein